MTHGSQALSHFPLGRSLHGSRHSCNRRYRGTGVRSLVKRTWQCGRLDSLPCCRCETYKQLTGFPRPYIASRAILSRGKIRQGVT